MRELIVLGTASQVPTRDRAHHGCLLRWDDEGILFDPGEGAQRQLLLAGVPASAITRICITHFHGDHCLGLPGIVQRLSLDGVEHEVSVHYPASGNDYLERLRNASIFHDRVRLREHPLAGSQSWGHTVRRARVEATGHGSRQGPTEGRGETPAAMTHWTAHRLAHPVETYGYRLREPDGRRMVPELLAAHRISGPAIGQLQRAGGPLLDAVSVPKRGQVFAFVMDTGVCDAAIELAADADLLVIESTFLESEAELAAIAGHLTAAQAARIAAEAGVRKLVLTHFSQRYPDSSVFGDEAARHFGGEIVIARELDRIRIR
ncbi:ribonuclease Z [Allorhizocola rhizosphaerae]|uniref:ribonuclease Z n=1 Tax=Allorhizocola rhizosphaerae TaxID=1872709 RepID=UPI000E3D2BAD|nr:ribonuclease Z [Allorhizocola rhizosphaerae]